MRPYRPKRGSSPLRFEISALAIRKLSIAAIRRANSDDEGARATEAVLDIGNPFLEAANPAASCEGNLRIPDASVHPRVCIAAYILPHCGIAAELGTSIDNVRRTKNVML